MEPAPSSTHLIKLALRVFRYDSVLLDWGWYHDVYYDTKSQQYIIANFPKKDHMFELSFKPEPGPAEVWVHGEEHHIQILET